MGLNRRVQFTVFITSEHGHNHVVYRHCTSYEKALKVVKDWLGPSYVDSKTWAWKGENGAVISVEHGNKKK